MNQATIATLIDRFDYSGAYCLCCDKAEDSALLHLLDIARSMVNFDFVTAQSILTVKGDFFPLSFAAYLEQNLLDLIYGEPNAIFSEHLANMYFQMEREEYIDLLGRLYRFSEAFLKYVFIKEHQKVLSVYDSAFEEGRALRILKKRYRIYNRNIIFAVVEYIHKHSDNPALKSCADFITDPKMKALADLRNASIVGHGFEAVSYSDVLTAYGEPINLLRDLEAIMQRGGLEIDRKKYSKINAFLIKELDYVNWKQK
ncbi:MAG: hypothetical protein GX046_01685 [Tissierellia bacterium]|nr:hypothetical protein [Tissierellia bacterium]